MKQFRDGKIIILKGVNIFCDQKQNRQVNKLFPLMRFWVISDCLDKEAIQLFFLIFKHSDCIKYSLLL